jgi:hypothetical protein
MSGEVEKESKFGRSVTRIELIKISDDKFKLLDLKEIYTV